MTMAVVVAIAVAKLTLNSSTKYKPVQWSVTIELAEYCRQPELLRGIGDTSVISDSSSRFKSWENVLL